MDISWLVAGTGLTAGYALWPVIKRWLGYFATLFVVTAEVKSPVSAPVLWYCLKNRTQRTPGRKTFHGWDVKVRRSWNGLLAGEVRTVIAESLGLGTWVMWYGRTPIAIRRTSGESSTDNANAVRYQPVELTFIRGTLDLDEFLLHVTDDYQKSHRAGREKRFTVERQFGTVGRRVPEEPHHQYRFSDPDVDTDEIASSRLLRYSFSDIGNRLCDNMLDSVWQSSEVQTFTDDFRQFLRSQAWFEQRSIPWRRGYVLTGDPGNGKTSTVRALAVDHNMPIYSMDLASMFNEELHRNWNTAISNAPCIVLMEDFDGVFHGRRAVNDEVKLTFDALLNTIDGASESTGVVLVITTNRIDTLDDALKGRPGRVDMMVEFPKPDENGRRHIAGRIVIDDPLLSEQLVHETADMSAAQVQERCRQAVLLQMTRKRRLIPA